jgi:hypothetical protein
MAFAVSGMDERKNSSGDFMKQPLLTMLVLSMLSTSDSAIEVSIVAH